MGSIEVRNGHGRRAREAELSLESLESRILLSSVSWTIEDAQAVSFHEESHTVTGQELVELQDYLGVRTEDTVPSVRFDGHGTGLQAPSVEEWEVLAQDLQVVDNYQPFGQPLQLPNAVDWSTSEYFPPIGNQDGEGSCTAWSTAYYTKTFQEASEHGWDLSGANWEGGYKGHPTPSYQDRIFSPDFVYHQINGGRDRGASFPEAADLIYDIGAASWEKMPNDPDDHTSWPAEAAWREAPIYRGDSGANILDVRASVQSLKNVLAGGNLAQIAIDAGDLYDLDNDTAHLDNFDNWSINHANTIVGYDDTYSYEEGGVTRQGAFKVANSWGDSWHSEANNDGCWWLSYSAMQQRVGWATYFTDRTGYNPETVAVVDLDHANRGDTEVTFGVGDPAWPSETKTFDSPGRSSDGDDPYPEGKIVFDISELNFDPADGPNFFVKVEESGSFVSGSISSFSIEHYSDYIQGTMGRKAISPDTPVPTAEGQTRVAEAFFAWTDVQLMQSSDTGVSSSDKITSDDTPMLGVTVNGPGEVELDWENDGTVDETRSVNYAGVHTFAPSTALSDGDITSSVTFVANPLNEASAATTTTIDTTAPAVPGSPDLQPGSDSGVADDDDLTNVASPEFDIPSSPDAGYFRFYRDGAHLSGDYETGSSYWAQGQPPGTWDYAVTAVDVAGNESALSVPLTVIIDRQAAWTPESLKLKESSDTGVSSTDGITRDAAPYYDVTVNEAGTIAIDWESNGTVDLTSPVSQGGTYSYAPAAALSDGPYNVKLTFEDRAGNYSSAQVSTVIDTTAPPVPSMPDLQSESDTGVSDSDDLTRADSLAFDFTKSGPYFRFYRDGTVVSGAYEEGSTYGLTGESEGTWNYAVSAVDVAGNEAPLSTGLEVVIDRTAPAMPARPDLQAASDSGISEQDNITNVSEPAFNVLPTGSYFRFYRDGSQISGDYELGHTYTPSPQADGEWDYSTAAVDAAGNESAASNALQVTIDTGAPSEPHAPDLQEGSDTGISDNDVTADKAPAFDVATPGPETYFRLYRDGQLVSRAPALGDDGQVYKESDSELLPEQPLGWSDFTATLVDAAGNESGHSSALDVCFTDAWPVAWHRYDDGVMVTIYDTDAEEGGTLKQPEIAWDRSEYKPYTDILVVPGRIGDGRLEAVLLRDGRGGTDDLGIAIEGNSSLGRLVDIRTSPEPLGFFASQGRVGLLQLDGGTAGGSLNNISTEGGWRMPEDIDGDGETDDPTGVYSPGGVNAIVAEGDLDGDTVLGGDLGVLRITGADLNGDLVMTGSRIGRVLVLGEEEGGNIAGDIETPGDVGVIYARNGDMTGNLRVGGSVRVVKAAGGDVAFSEIRTGESVWRVVAQGGNVRSQIDADQGKVGLVLARRDGSTGDGGTISGTISAGWNVGSVLALDGDGIEADIRADGRIGRVLSRGGDFDLSDGNRQVCASFGIGSIKVVDGDIVGDGQALSDEIKVWGGNIGALQTVRGNIMGMAVNVAGMARSGCIGTVAALQADEGIMNSTFEVESQLATVRVTCKWDTNAGAWTGGNMDNTSIDATRLRRVVVMGRISEDASNGRADHICADLGSYVASDSSWTGWINRTRPHWFDEGEEGGLQAFAL